MPGLLGSTDFIILVTVRLERASFRDRIFQKMYFKCNNMNSLKVKQQKIQSVNIKQKDDRILLLTNNELFLVKIIIE